MHLFLCRILPRKPTVLARGHVFREQVFGSSGAASLPGRLQRASSSFPRGEPPPKFITVERRAADRADAPQAMLPLSLSRTRLHRVSEKFWVNSAISVAEGGTSVRPRETQSCRCHIASDTCDVLELCCMACSLLSNFLMLFNPQAKKELEIGDSAHGFSALALWTLGAGLSLPRGTLCAVGC